MAYEEYGDTAQIFDDADDIILAAYNYVGKTSCQIVDHSDGKNLLIGFKSSDGKYFLGRRMQLMQGNNRKILDQIRQQNVSILDFVNKQLMILL